MKNVLNLTNNINKYENTYIYFSIRYFKKYNYNNFHPILNSNFGHTLFMFLHAHVHTPTCSRSKCFFFFFNGTPAGHLNTRTKLYLTLLIIIIIRSLGN